MEIEYCYSQMQHKLLAETQTADEFLDSVKLTKQPFDSFHFANFIIRSLFVCLVTIADESETPDKLTVWFESYRYKLD